MKSLLAILAVLAVLAVSVRSVAEELETWELDNPRIHSRRIDGVQKRFSVRKVERRGGGLFLNGRRVEVKAADWPEPFVPSTEFIRTFVAELKAHGIRVYSIPFEGGETEEVYYRLFELGCDGFSTDYPSVMFKVIGSLKGLALEG